MWDYLPLLRKEINPTAEEIKLRPQGRVMVLGTQMSEKSQPSSSQVSDQSKLSRQEIKNYLKYIFSFFSFHRFHIPQAGAALTLTPFVQPTLPSAAFKNPRAAPNGFGTSANFLC